MTRLTDTKVRRLTKPGLYSADTTLYLRVSKTGGKSWIQRIIFSDKRHDIGLGGWPVVTVDDAKERALANRRLVRSWRQSPDRNAQGQDADIQRGKQ